MKHLLFLLLLTPAAASAGVGPEDVLQIREAIGRQFLVRTPGCPVHGPASVRFQDLVLMGEEAVQQVQVTDPSGAGWVVYYAVQRQQDGTWRASGCRVVQPARTISA